METFIKLFGSLLLFVYHCYDRMVINGYLRGLSRPGQVAYFFHEVVGEPVIGKEVLSRRTNEYQAWVEAFARNHAPIEWACAKRIMCVPRCAASSGPESTACISS
jgi:hypothetical protein